MTPPVLETDRLILRPHRAEDHAAVAALWADPEVVRFIGGTPSSAEASWSRLLRYIGHWQALGFGYWAVTARDGGRFLGEAGFADFRRDMEPALNGTPEAGWVLAAEAHGRGIATEAVRCIHAWAEAEKDWRETVCIFDPAHAASQNVARKLGYEVRGEASYSGNPTLVMSRPMSRG
ncbi:GNAT family N-acetyltransferase [Roseobacteraceae bacterium NS-SX3]